MAPLKLWPAGDRAPVSPPAYEGDGVEGAPGGEPNVKRGCPYWSYKATRAAYDRPRVGEMAGVVLTFAAIRVPRMEGLLINHSEELLLYSSR